MDHMVTVVLMDLVGLAGPVDHMVLREYVKTGTIAIPTTHNRNIYHSGKEVVNRLEGIENSYMNPVH
jgi:hypothetical protein